MIITNERYGGDVLYEFKLKSELNYIPYIGLYNTDAGIYKNEV